MPTMECLCIFLVQVYKNKGLWGRLGGSVKHPTLAQVMISGFMGLSPMSVLTAQSLEPASESMSFSLSPPLLLSLGFSLSQK